MVKGKVVRVNVRSTLETKSQVEFLSKALNKSQSEIVEIAIRNLFVSYNQKERAIDEETLNSIREL